MHDVIIKWSPISRLYLLCTKNVMFSCELRRHPFVVIGEWFAFFRLAGCFLGNFTESQQKCALSSDNFPKIQHAHTTAAKRKQQNECDRSHDQLSCTLFLKLRHSMAKNMCTHTHSRIRYVPIGQYFEFARVAHSQNSCCFPSVSSVRSPNLAVLEKSNWHTHTHTHSKEWVSKARNYNRFVTILRVEEIGQLISLLFILNATFLPRFWAERRSQSFAGSEAKCTRKASLNILHASVPFARRAPSRLSPTHLNTPLKPFPN